MKDSLLLGILCPINIKYTLKKHIAKVLMFILLLFGTHTQANAQTKPISYSGIVVSAVDGKPLEGVRVRSRNVSRGFLSNRKGIFTVNTSTGASNILSASLEGYDDQDIKITGSFTKIILQPIGDPFRDSNPKFEALKIGEKVPDFEFAIKNYHSPTAKISDFKGKLLILDFWTTRCASCIYSFPKMEKLQKQYGDKIQVILVNVRESEAEIKSQLKNRRNPIPELESIPSVVSNLAMTQLFPHRFDGNYYWIDPEGILCLASPLYYNHHDEKINDVINGQEITFLDQGEFYGKGNKSLNQLISENSNQHMVLGSLFTHALREHVPLGGRVTGEIDSASSTLRNTYINQSVLKSYYYALNDFIKEEWKTRVYGPNRGPSSYLDAFSMQVKDSSLYDYRLIPNEKLTDINRIKSDFCYEQVLPLNITKEQADKIWREDIDRYFGLKYGTTFTIDEVMVPGYIIKRINYDPVTEKEIRKKLKHLGKREYKSLGDFDSVIDRFYRPDPSKNPEPWFPYVFDVDGINKEIETIMPAWKEGDKLEDFVLALNANGLDYIRGEKKIKKIVVRDNQ